RPQHGAHRAADPDAEPRNRDADGFRTPPGRVRERVQAASRLKKPGANVKLKDLIEALAGEIERAHAQLEESLAEVTTPEAYGPAFLDAYEQYSGQAERMGEAAELAGF